MKLSDDTLLGLREILSEKGTLNNREIKKVQHGRLRGIYLNDWYFLISSAVVDSRRLSSTALTETADGMCEYRSAEWQIIEIEGYESDTIATIRLESGHRPVAKLLAEWGDPSDIVQRDWQQQLSKLSGIHDVLFFSVSSDGVLSKLPAIHALEPIGVSSKLNDDEAATCGKYCFDESWKPIDWPWETWKGKCNLDESSQLQTSQLQIDLSQNQTMFSLSAESSQAKAKGRKQSLVDENTKLRRKVGVASLVTALVIGFFLYLLLTPTEKGLGLSGDRNVVESVSRLDQSAPKELRSDGASEADIRIRESLVNSDSQLIDTDALVETELNQSTLDATEFLPMSNQLAKFLDGPSVTTQLFSSSIIENSLGASHSLKLDEPMETMEEAETRSDGVVDGKDRVDGNDGTPLVLDLDAGIERSIRLAEANNKDRIAIRQKLLSRDGTCAATLQLQDMDKREVSILPEESIQIVGNGICAWTIGLEDSEPEVVVRLQSKPGRRWDVVALVGFRENKSNPPRLLAPGNAKLVVNQLIVAKRAILGLLEQNQIARESGVRSNVDLYDQRRQLQRQEKELDKAMENWKTLEKLSFVVFDHAKVVVKLSQTTAL